MAASHTVIENLDQQVRPPEDGILTRTLYKSDTIRVVMFGFSPGQSLSEHTSTMEAVLHFLEGEADVTLGGETVSAGPGTWIRMEPNLKHSVTARSACVMQLTLIKA